MLELPRVSKSGRVLGSFIRLGSFIDMVFYPLEGCREYSNAENPGKFHDTQDGYRTGNAIRQITSWSQSHQPSKQRVRAAIHQFHVGTPGLWQALKQRPKILLLTTDCATPRHAGAGQQRRKESDHGCARPDSLEPRT